MMQFTKYFLKNQTLKALDQRDYSTRGLVHIIQK